MSLTHRKNTILKVNSSDSTRPDFAGSYDVTVLPVGAICSGASSDTTIPVHAGHGITADDQVMVGTDVTTFRAVSSVTATQITVGVDAVTVADGDKLVNLGPDTGTTTPLYDGAQCVIYDNPAASSALSNSRVTCDAQGEYEFWFRGDGMAWELIRDGDGTPVEINTGWGGVPGRFNIADFGAKVDAVTDDQVRIKAAVDAASASGASASKGYTVYFPPGDTYVQNPIILPRSGNVPSGVVWLEGSHDLSSQISAGSSFPTSRGVIEWDTQRSGINAIRYIPNDTTDLAAIIAERFQYGRFENIHISGHNDFHTEFIYIGGNLNLCNFTNIVGDGTVGSGTADIYLFKFDTTPHAFSGLDYAGANNCLFQNVTAGFRAGGRIAGVVGRMNRCTVDNFSCGIKLKSLPFFDLTNATANVFTGCFLEGGGSQPQMKLTSCERNFFHMTIGGPVDTGGAGTGDGWEFASSSDNVVYGETGYAESFAWGTTGDKYATFDASSHRNTIRDVGLAEGTEAAAVAVVTNNGNDNFIEFYDYDLSAYVQLGGRGVTTLANNATPSITYNTVFKTGGTTTITDFDNGYIGKTIKVLAEHSVTITHNASIIVLNGNVNFDMVSGDTLTLTMFNDGVWHEISRRAVPKTAGVITTLASGATPSVSAGNLFKTGSGGTAITRFLNGTIGQIITILADDSRTITYNAVLMVLNGNTDFAMVAGDTLTMAKFTSGDDLWYEVARNNRTP
jgi:hypothetical protein